MSLDVSQLALFLSVLSSVAIIASAIFVIFQVRLMTRGNKSNIAFSILERIISDEFVRRRTHVYKIAAKYGLKK